MSTNDLSIYELPPDTWWDDDQGPMAPLHWLTPARFRYFARVAGPLRGKRVLDVGCGGGLLAEPFAAAGAHVVAADLLHACAAAGSTHARQNGRPVTYLRARAEQLAFADGSFDVAVAADVLEHVDDLPQTLGEIGRVLRDDGIFLFDTANRTRLAQWILIELAENVLGVVPRGAHDWHRFIKPRELRSRLQAAGMKLEHLTGLAPIGYWRRRVRFARLPVTSLTYMGWARKLPARCA
jgi:2-polyprenyl-6-hydroxyphenyl methylase/3-demethylubiquinone-9 3-methyltransferase